MNKDSDIEDFEKLNLKILYNPCPADSSVLNHLYTMFVLPWIILFHKINVAVYPQICIYLFNPFCKVILYMHDLIEYHYDSQTKSKLLFRKIAYPYDCKHADIIVTVSESTKKDLIDIFGISSDKIVVAWNGKNEALTPVDKEKARNHLMEVYNISNFILYLGYITHPQKNLLYLIDEFAKFHKQHPESQLVFAGAEGKNSDMILEHAKVMLPSNAFKYLGRGPFEELRNLYSACELFCFPSLFEGFGIPVLEAMSCGAVVLTSNCSSFPEILPDKRFLINPREKGELSEAMQTFYGKDNTQIITSNIERAKLFTWDNHCRILENVIQKLL